MAATPVKMALEGHTALKLPPVAQPLFTARVPFPFV
jgi:hypothetical protein